MEPIQELRKNLQEEKMHPNGWSRPWGYIFFQRGPSIYITRLLIPTGISANMVTSFAIFSSIFGALMLYGLPHAYKSVGIALFYLGLLFDKTDGEIARYRKTFSLKGIYLDEIYHIITPPLFFIGLVFGLAPYVVLENRILFFFGTLAGTFALALRVSHSLPQQIFIKKYLKHPDLFTMPAPLAPTTESPTTTRTAFYYVGRLLHQFQDFFVMLATFLVLINTEYILRLDYLFYPFTVWGIIGYGFYFPLLFFERVLRGTKSIQRDIARLRDEFTAS